MPDDAMHPLIVSLPAAASPDDATAGGDMQKPSLSEGQSDHRLRTSSTIDTPNPIAQALAQHAYGARGAYAPNTERALNADIAIFTRWCCRSGVDQHKIRTPIGVASP